MMEVEINPKLLDVVKVQDSDSGPGKGAQGTIVGSLGGPLGTALIEIADEFGVPLAFVSRPSSELKKVWDVATSKTRPTEIPEAQELFETGILYLQNGLIPRSKEYLGKAFSIDRNLARDMLNKTIPLAESGAFETAIFICELLLELVPNYDLARENLAIAFLNRGIAFGRQGFFAKAIEDFDRALLVRPSDRIIEAVRKNTAAAYGNVGVLNAETKQYREALRFLQWALELDPLSVTVGKNLGITMIALSVLTIQGTSISAKEDILRQPLMMGLTLSECLNAYGATLATLGKFAEAKEALEDAIKADPRNETPKKNLEILLTQEANRVFVVGLVRFEIQMPDKVRP
jgi:tetratricopeptide (TPR) repeat protein